MRTFLLQHRTLPCFNVLSCQPSPTIESRMMPRGNVQTCQHPQNDPCRASTFRGANVPLEHPNMPRSNIQTSEETLIERYGTTQKAIISQMLLDVSPVLQASVRPTSQKLPKLDHIVQKCVALDINHTRCRVSCSRLKQQ